MQLKETTMLYQVRPTAETIWAVLTTVALAVAQLMGGSPPDDWRVWGLAALGAAVRAAGGVLLSQVDVPLAPKG
jgi:hypothetical protein